MPTIMTHTAVPISIWIMLGKRIIPLRLLIVGIFFAILPDVDVVTFKFGIPYESDWGHRGFSHSILFAFSLSVLASILVRWFCARIEVVFLFLSILSHGVLDAMTSGGLGIGFLIPYSSKRFFFDQRPISVSPIGIKNFLTARGLEVLRSELFTVWIPLLSIAISIFLIRILIRRINTRAKY
ncbi:metal-dependent hydrolase [Leptospira interrogans]|uniref:metal-dependent hydrolase n=1 Tax=Leptospira interrogans TaxID=173 RepID=UPI001F0D403F|nr:metal-dependent hydrolase [Leptospira interrogans]UMQ59503.1 metal-dependent hydrolase [Leptospira interrogans]UNE68424.1 metal-dependent hydrolase [Leptospira interrogans]